ncbi:hypothetical protein [Flammeovirga aprica]|uniref:Uncharacterized protein n=1 Tax=Flammeovirga aprica JL-4 TaxID=694437 RepID=A0A7X9NZV9_9BACT|nr:hypothetical protein [Flammeovirga aprica]NME66938.1 hypothetical protein [Flammeovirga aprica JL-4]
MKYTLLIIALFLVSNTVFSQKKYNKSIIEFKQFNKTKDHRVRTYLKVNELTDEIILYVFPYDAFDDFFKYKDDGISIDLIQKKQYSCENFEVVKYNEDYRGQLLKKVYRDELIKKRRKNNSDNYAVIPLGKLPQKYNLKDIELNYFIVRGGEDHYYRTSYNIDTEQLPYYDLPLVYFSPPQKKSNSILHQSINNEEIEYKLHFEKNKTQFDSLEFKKLYDYLHLSDYRITSFYIKAYSSIDGDPEQNANLSYLRSQQIVNELSPFMTDGVKSIIETGENWNKFFEDIKGTEYEYLLQKGENEIRKEVNKNTDKFEHLLSQQRIATIKVRLEKLVTYELLEESESYELFGDLVSKDDYEEAYLLQS